tara:strand:- start:40588 stop:41088 length:501 start_codon:yes stop_codon:yes gene_type:complete
MAKKKKRSSKKTSTRKTSGKSKKKKKVVNSSPQFMVQISEPKMLRKDVLESLRESIIFLQGYETIRKLQQEKVALFNQVKVDVKELHDLIEHKLKKLLPEGKLKPHKHKPKPKVQPQAPTIPVISSRHIPSPPPASPKPAETKVVQTGLDDLEKQLSAIENQLRNV